MSHFYGTLQGSRGEATRCGTRSSGITTHAASWEGAVRVTVFYNPTTARDEVDVSLVPWHGVGTTRLLYRGPIGGADNDVSPAPASAPAPEPEYNPVSENPDADAPVGARVAEYNRKFNDLLYGRA